jgi:hypothetical protein
MHFEMRLMQYGDITTNRTWLVFANEKRCDHILSIMVQGFISWIELAKAFIMDRDSFTHTCNTINYVQ